MLKNWKTIVKVVVAVLSALLGAVGAAIIGWGLLDFKKNLRFHRDDEFQNMQLLI